MMARSPREFRDGMVQQHAHNEPRPGELLDHFLWLPQAATFRTGVETEEPLWQSERGPAVAP